MIDVGYRHAEAVDISADGCGNRVEDSRNVIALRALRITRDACQMYRWIIREMLGTSERGWRFREEQQSCSLGAILFCTY